MYLEMDKTLLPKDETLKIKVTLRLARPIAAPLELEAQLSPEGVGGY